MSYSEVVTKQLVEREKEIKKMPASDERARALWICEQIRTTIIQMSALKEKADGVEAILSKIRSKVTIIESLFNSLP